MSEVFKIALIDDHTLVRNLIAKYVDTFEGCQVVFQVESGKQLIEQITPINAPDVVLMDILMPDMNGFETSEWLKQHYPSVRILVLSMINDETAMVRLIRAGAKGFLRKDTDEKELERAIRLTMKTGYYFGPSAGKLLGIFRAAESNASIGRSLVLTDTEMRFLQLASEDLTYKQIALKMGVAARTVDNYRDQLFLKLGVKTRTGLVLRAVKSGFVSFDSVS